MNWDWEKLKKQQEGKGEGPVPPKVGDLVEKFKSVKFPGSPLLILLIVLLVLIFLGSSMFYTIGVDEVGVVQRFGKYVRIAQPGLNFKLPRGIEEVKKVRVRHIFKDEFGFRTLEAGVRTRYASGSAYLDESLMLTGDLNVAVVPWVTQYRINDPYKYLFKVQDQQKTLSDLAEATMRRVIGDRSINEVISKREEIAVAAKLALQKELDEVELGIKVVTIEMKKTNVPEAVQPSFNEVNQAIQEKEQMIYQAKKEYNKVIPEAKGNAEKTIKTAQGYAISVLNRAEGDTQRFSDLYNAYKNAKDVTRRRLFLDAMQQIMPKLGKKYIMDADQKNVLPLLNLEQPGGEKK
ncbi:MAG TPA: FtsH protease activity modulator HflK [Desulfobacterales bacterium]|nr:FtsH protease activity modulator HflK [Desulfobacterales bacterium]